MIIDSTLHYNVNYDTNQYARVSDRLLQTLYIKAGLRPVDMYSSFDKEGRDVIVMMFDKEQSSKYYEAWKNHTLAEILNSKITE